MVGVSGGSFLVPLMVLDCGVPIYTAVGTASTLISATASATIPLGSITVGAITEESATTKKFGDTYKKYIARTPRWIGLAKSKKT